MLRIVFIEAPGLWLLLVGVVFASAIAGLIPWSTDPSSYDTPVGSSVSKYRSSERSSERKDEGDIHGAWAYMQLFVEKRLKSPKTASFPWGASPYVTPLGEGRYMVRGYVDSQNGFGALLRTRFEGVIKRYDGGWQLENLQLLE